MLKTVLLAALAIAAIGAFALDLVPADIGAPSPYVLMGACVAMWIGIGSRRRGRRINA